MKKYLYKGQYYTDVQVAQAATKKGLSFDDYVSKFGLQEVANEVKKKEQPLPESNNGSQPGSQSESQSSSTNEKPFSLSPNQNTQNPTTGNDLYDFMTKPAAYVAGKTVEAKTNNLQPVSEVDVKDLKLNRPDLYQNIKAGLNDKTATKDIYDDTDVAVITQKLNKNTANVKDQVIAANFEKVTGLNYNPISIASITATQRRDLGIPPLPGDKDLLDKEFVTSDIDKNFQQQKDPFLPAVAGAPSSPLSPNLLDPTGAENLKALVVNDPEKRRDYTVRRQIEEQQKIDAKQQEINSKMSDLITGSISRNKDFDFEDKNKVKKEAELKSEITAKQTELQAFNKILQQQKQIAESASDILEPQRVAKEKGFDLNTVEGRFALRDYLSTEAGRRDIGFSKKINSDAKFAATVGDLFADKLSEVSGVASGNPLAIIRSIIDPANTDIPTNPDELFKSLSDSGNDKIQAQIRLAGHESAKNYAKANGDDDLLAHLQGQDAFVVQENGQAVKEELWARLSNQRFKNNNSKVGGGADKINKGQANEDEILKLAKDAGFSDAEMLITKNYPIPDELSRTITSNFQTSGFFENFGEALGGLALNVGNIARNDQSRIKENLNENTGKLEEIGQYSPFIQELDQLQTKRGSQERLTQEEEKRLTMLENNTNLLSGWQKLKAGSGNVTGQVVGQAVFASLLGGVGGVLAKGLGLAGGEILAAGVEGEVLTAEAAAAGRMTIATAENGLRAETAGAKILARNAEGNPIQWSTGKNVFVSRESLATAESALRAEAGGARILARNAEGQPIKWSFGGEIAAPELSLGGKVVNYAKENANLFASSYANAYDGYAKQSLEEMPGAGNGMRRSLFAGMMATFEGLSEKIFDDTKVLKSFGKEISPAVVSIASQLSNKTITQAAAIKKLQEVILGGANLKTFAKKFLINSNQEGIEEGVVDLAGDLAKAMIFGQNYDAAASIGGALKTYYSMVVDGALVAGVAARGDARSHSINKTTMYHVANNAQEYRSEIQRLRTAGDITEEQRVEKNIIINTAEAAYKNMQKDGIIDRNGKDDAKNSQYLLHTVNQAVLQERAANAADDVVKADYLKQAERSKKIREALYTGKANVDQFLNVVTPDPATAKDLDIEQEVPVPTAEEELYNSILNSPTLPKVYKDGMKLILQNGDFGAALDGLSQLIDAPISAIKQLGQENADKLFDRIPVEKFEAALADLKRLTNDPANEKALEDIIAKKKGTPAAEVKAEPIVLTAEQKKETFISTTPKEKVELSAARKAGTADEYLLQLALAKGIVTQPAAAAPLAESTAPKEGDKVMYQGVEHTVQSVYDTPTGTRSYSLVDADGNQLLGANSKPKFVSATSISPINTSNENTQSNQAPNTQGNNAQANQNTQTGNNEENKVITSSSNTQNESENKKGNQANDNETNGKQSSGQENGQNGNGKNGQKEEVKNGTTATDKAVVSFNPKENQFEALARLTKGIENLPADQQKAEIEKRAAEHEASYKEFTKGENKISDENSKKQRVSEFAGQTAKAMAKFLTPKGKEAFAPNKGPFENGSRIDENGNAISENDFITLKEKVKQLRKEKNEAEIKKINEAPAAYLNSFDSVPKLVYTKEEGQKVQDQVFAIVSNLAIGTVIKNGDGIQIITENSISKNGSQVIGITEFERQKDGSLIQTGDTQFVIKNKEGKIKSDYNPHTTYTNTNGQRVTETAQITNENIDLSKEKILVNDSDGNLVESNSYKKQNGSTTGTTGNTVQQNQAAPQGQTGEGGVQQGTNGNSNAGTIGATSILDVESTAKALESVIPKSESFTFAINTLPIEGTINYKDIKQSDYALPFERYVNSPEKIDKEIGSAYKIYEFLKSGGKLPNNVVLLDKNGKILDGNNRVKAQLALGIKDFDYAVKDDKLLSQSNYKTIAEAYHADKAAGKETELTKAIELLLKLNKNESTEKNNDNQSVLEGVQQAGNQNEGGKSSEQLREEEKLALNFVAEKDLPTTEEPVIKNGKPVKTGGIVVTKEVPNPELVAAQQAIKDKLKTLEKLVKCLTK